MIHHVRGKLVEKSAGRAVIEVGGVGIELQVPSGTLSALPEEGEEAELHTRLVLRDSGPVLCGFASRAELAAFDLLSSVSGVGPAVALGAVSELGAAGLADVLERADPSDLRRVRRVGRRLAERIVVELKDRAGELAAMASGSAPSAVAEARKALVGLGYPPGDAAENVRKAAAALDGGATVEDLVREALRLDSAGRRA